MEIKKILYAAVFCIIALFVAYRWFFVKPKRETIFDEVVNVPKELVLNVPYLPPLCEQIPEQNKGFVPIKDGKLYYEEEGQGIPLVLISGGPGCTHQVFHPYFSRIKDSARIIYYDQRGVGKSSKDNTGTKYTVKQAVEDLEELRKTLKIEKWALLGWSYGGLLAQLYALTYPNRCIGIILGVSEITIYKHYEDTKRTKTIISKEEKAAVERIKTKAEKGELSPLQAGYNVMLSGEWKRYNYYKPTKEELIRKVLYSWDSTPEFEKKMKQDIYQTKLKSKFENFEIPTLIMEAKWELLWWDNAEERTELFRKNHPHAQIEIFEKSGHMIFADEPEKFFRLVRKFLKKIEN